MKSQRYIVIVTGTDPRSKTGGIATALPGYLSAMQQSGIEYVFVPTHHAVEKHGKWRPWLKSFPIILRTVRKSRHNGKIVYLYAHPGAGVSLIRQGILLGFFRLGGVKSVVQIHSIDIFHYLNKWPKRILFKLSIFPANTIAVLTPWWQQQFKSMGTWKQTVVIPNPLPRTLEYTAKRSLLVRAIRHDKNILTVTRIVEGKGVDLLIKAMALLPNHIKLTIAGNGAQLPALKKLTKSIGLCERVTFIGWVSGQQKQKALEEADVFCLPSNDDSFGMGFVEAMANGLPIVAQDWGPISDVVPNKRCGILIQSHNAQELSKALLTILLMDAEDRRVMGEAGKKWVLNSFGSRRIGSYIKQMFDDI
jgi:glycosyltransferase involved in cell wall biosynthesis